MVGFIRGCAWCGVIGLLAIVASGCGSSSSSDKPSGATMTAEQRKEADMAREKAVAGNKMGDSKSTDSGKMGGKADDGKMGTAK